VFDGIRIVSFQLTCAFENLFCRFLLRLSQVEPLGEIRTQFDDFSVHAFVVDELHDCSGAELFAEGDDTLIVAANPRQLTDKTYPELEPVMKKIEKDLLGIFQTMRNDD